MLNNSVRVMRGPLSEVWGRARVFLISCRLDCSEVNVRKNRKNSTSFWVRLKITAFPLTSYVYFDQLLELSMILFPLLQLYSYSRLYKGVVLNKITHIKWF